MWPFKAKKRMTMEEYIESRGNAPCGNPQHHWRAELDGWPCYVCAAMETRAYELEEENRLVEKIAKKVCELLKKNPE